jgi:hypothetical protein
LTTGSCDATLIIDARANVDYLVRFTSTDSKIALYTDVIAAVNDGQRNISGGPVFSGASIWINLGPCKGVSNYDFIISIVFDDLGGNLYP